MVGSGLHHGQIVFGTQAKEGQGHANVVVEIALGIMYVVFAAKDSGQEFLGGGLSVGSGYLDHGSAPLSAVPCRQLLEGGQDIIHQHKTGISGRDNRPVVHHCHCTPLLQRLPGILVAIERLATKREKHTARRTFTAVRGYHRMFLINPVKRCDIHLHFSYFIFSHPPPPCSGIVPPVANTFIRLRGCANAKIHPFFDKGTQNLSVLQILTNFVAVLKHFSQA